MARRRNTAKVRMWECTMYARCTIWSLQCTIGTMVPTRYPKSCCRLVRTIIMIVIGHTFVCRWHGIMPYIVPYHTIRTWQDPCKTHPRPVFRTQHTYISVEVWMVWCGIVPVKHHTARTRDRGGDLWPPCYGIVPYKHTSFVWWHVSPAMTHLFPLLQVSWQRNIGTHNINKAYVPWVHTIHQAYTIYLTYLSRAMNGNPLSRLYLVRARWCG